MSLKDKAKDLVEKTKLAADEATQKVKDVDVDQIKGEITGEDGKISIDSIKSLSNKTKAIGVSIAGVILLLIIMLFSGGRSYSLETLAEGYPEEGSLQEQCESASYVKYDAINLLNDDVPASEIVSTLKKVRSSFDSREASSYSYAKKLYMKTAVSMEMFADRFNPLRDNKRDFEKSGVLETHYYTVDIELCMKASGEK